VSYTYISNPGYGIYEKEERIYSAIGGLASPTKNTPGFWCPCCLFNEGRFSWIVGSCRICGEWFDKADPIVTYLMSVR
jgi:hypothetical protein